MRGNRNKIQYRFYDENLNVKEVAEEFIGNILVKATPTSSCWWSKMKTRMDGFKSQLDMIKHRQHMAISTGEDIPPWGGSTAKTCPGIVDLLTTSYLIKSPTDVVITIDNRGVYYALSADESILTVSEHDVSQFQQDDATLFKGKIAIKFSIKVLLSTTGFGYILADPTYHANLGCFVPMGILNSDYAKLTELNVITLVDIPKGENKVITIKAGDVLAYLVPFEKCELAFAETAFIRGFFKSFQSRHRYK
jgi:hypothetical protein